MTSERMVLVDAEALAEVMPLLKLLLERGQAFGAMTQPTMGRNPSQAKLDVLEARLDREARPLKVARLMTALQAALSQPAPQQEAEMLYRKVVEQGMTEAIPGTTEEEMEALPMEEWEPGVPPMPFFRISYEPVPMPTPQPDVRELKAAVERYEAADDTCARAFTSDMRGTMARRDAEEERRLATVNLAQVARTLLSAAPGQEAGDEAQR